MRIRGVGNTLYWNTPAETFHEFLIRLLKLTLGKDWYFSELKKSDQDRHQIMKWLWVFHEWQRVASTDENRIEGGWSAVPPGEVWALFALAYDVYQLKNTGNASARLIARLKKRHEFQGARYELAVASIFARCDFALDYFDDLVTTRHVEFLAKHRPSGALIAVEAKSRRRPGVLHEAGDLDLDRALQGDIAGLVRDAIDQCPVTVPALIFVDVNSPPSNVESPFDRPYFDGVKRMIERLSQSNSTAPEPYNAVFVTNFPYHYVQRDAAPPPEVLAVFSPRPCHAFSPELMSLVWRACETYGRIPEADLEADTQSPEAPPVTVAAARVRET